PYQGLVRTTGRRYTLILANIYSVCTEQSLLLPQDILLYLLVLCAEVIFFGNSARYTYSFQRFIGQSNQMFPLLFGYRFRKFSFMNLPVAFCTQRKQVLKVVACYRIRTGYDMVHMVCWSNAPCNHTCVTRAAIAKFWVQRFTSVHHLLFRCFCWPSSAHTTLLNLAPAL